LIVSIALVVVGFVTFVGAIISLMKADSSGNKKATISMYYLLIVSALGIVLSIISIVKAHTRISDIPGTPSDSTSSSTPISTSSSTPSTNEQTTQTNETQ
jgi:hypothetical protein